jgi:hypothetical protein
MQALRLTRKLATSSILRHAIKPAPLCTFTEEELMLKDVVSKYAKETIKPLVPKMDKEEQMDKAVIQGLFEQGV